MMPRGLRHRAWAAGAPGLSAGRPGACAPPRALLRAHRAGRRARACSTWAAAASACARWSPTSPSPGWTSTERPEYPGPFVRADAAEGLPFGDDEFDLVYCSSVIEHVPPARRAGVRRRAAPRGPGLVRADARPAPSRSSPTRCCRAPMAAGRAAPALLAPGRGRRLGGDLAAAPRASWRSCSAPPGRSASAPLVKSWVCVSPRGGRCRC